MIGLMEVFRGVLVFGAIATANVSADQTEAQVHPGITHLQALFAAVTAGMYFVNLFQMRTAVGHVGRSTR
jgi:hypothetical protein